MRTAVALSVVLLASAILIGASPADKLASVAPAFQVDVDVHPSTQDRYQLLRQTPSSYTCSAVISSFARQAPDGTKRPVMSYAHPEVVVEPGQTETAIRKFGDDYAVKFTVTVAATRNEAHASVEITHGGEMISRQISRIRFSTPRRTIEPAG